MAKLNDRWLLTQFNDFNGAFFGGRIPSNVQVEFGKTGDSNGLYDTDDKTITIDIDDAKRGNERTIKLHLLHEMIHADLDVEGYVGHEKDPLHGTRFKGEICRLWRIGAYDGLL